MDQPPQWITTVLQAEVNNCESSDVTGTALGSSDGSRAPLSFPDSEGPGECPPGDPEGSDTDGTDDSGDFDEFHDSDDSDDSDEPATAVGVMSTNSVRGENAELLPSPYCSQDFENPMFDESMDDVSDSDDDPILVAKFMEDFRVVSREILENEGNIRYILRIARYQNLGNTIAAFAAELCRSRETGRPPFLGHRNSGIGRDARRNPTLAETFAALSAEIRRSRANRMRPPLLEQRTDADWLSNSIL
jgi:hypothetical protein